jgi:hypothetical protein
MPPLDPPKSQQDPIVPSADTNRRAEVRTSGNEIVLVAWNESDGTHRSQRARITDRSQKGLGLHLASPIPVLTRVDVTGGTSLQGVVQNCRSEQDGYVVGLLRLSSDRRASLRQLVKGTATLSWRRPQGEEQATTGTVLNATTEGIQVQTSIEIPVPILVRVVGEGVEHIAETRYRESKDDRFLIGLRFLRARPEGRASSQE